MIEKLFGHSPLVLASSWRVTSNPIPLLAPVTNATDPGSALRLTAASVVTKVTPPSPAEEAPVVANVAQLPASIARRRPSEGEEEGVVGVVVAIEFCRRWLEEPLKPALCGGHHDNSSGDLYGRHHPALAWWFARLVAAKKVRGTPPVVAQKNMPVSSVGFEEGCSGRLHCCCVCLEETLEATILVRIVADYISNPTSLRFAAPAAIIHCLPSSERCVNAFEALIEGEGSCASHRVRGS